MTAEAAGGPRSGQRDSIGSPRRQARLAAVQALYQIEMSGGRPADVVKEWLLHRLGKIGGDVNEGTAGAVDLGLFNDLVEGTSARRADLDGMLAPALAEGWKIARLEIVLLAILRTAIYELIARSDVPARVAITEYVDIARGFFAGREPAFVNGVLDRLARKLRPDEFDRPTSEPVAVPGQASDGPGG